MCSFFQGEKMVTQICYCCKKEKEVEKDEPYECECGVWNQSEKFKKEMRDSMDFRMKKSSK